MSALVAAIRILSIFGRNRLTRGLARPMRKAPKPRSGILQVTQGGRAGIERRQSVTSTIWRSSRAKWSRKKGARHGIYRIRSAVPSSPPSTPARFRTLRQWQGAKVKAGEPSRSPGIRSGRAAGSKGHSVTARGAQIGGEHFRRAARERSSSGRRGRGLGEAAPVGGEGRARRRALASSVSRDQTGEGFFQ